MTPLMEDQSLAVSDCDAVLVHSDVADEDLPLTVMLWERTVTMTSSWTGMTTCN